MARIASEGGGTFTETDGGTVVYCEPLNSSSNGQTMTGFWSDTVTFSLLATTTSSYTSSNSHTHITRTDSVVEYYKTTAVDGTGAVQSSTSTSQVTYDFTAATNSPTTYTLDSSGSGTSQESQQGVSSPGAGDQTTESDKQTSFSSSHISDTISPSGVTNVNYTNSNGGSDQYSESDAITAPADTENDQLSGNDVWSNGNSGSYQNNANGTFSSSNTSNETSSGKELYFQ